MIAFVVCIAYLAITTLVGICLNRKVGGSDNTKNFFVANKTLTPAMVMCLMFGEMIAGSSTVGSATSAFSNGISSVWSNWGQAIGVIVFVIFVGKFFRQASHYGAMSVPEAFEWRFDRKTRMVVLVIVLVVYGIMYALQPIAAANILAPMLGCSTTLMAWIVIIIFCCMALVGLKGVAGMNVVHAIVMYGGMGVITFLAIKNAGGIGGMKAALTVNYFDLSYPRVSTMMGNALGSCCGFILSSTLVNNYYSSKNLKTAKTGVTMAAVAVIIFALMPSLIGIAGKVIMPDAEPGTILYTLADSFSPVIGGIAGMAILAAVFSTAPAFLLTLSTTVTRDFFKVVKPDATDKQQLIFSKVCIFAIAIIAGGLGLNIRSILNNLLGAFQIRGVAGMVLIVSLLWKRLTNNAAFAGTMLGGITAMVWHFSGQPFGIPPFWAGALVGLVSMIVVTLIWSEGQESIGYRKYREAVEKIPKEEL